MPSRYHLHLSHSSLCNCLPEHAAPDFAPPVRRFLRRPPRLDESDRSHLQVVLLCHSLRVPEPFAHNMDREAVCQIRLGTGAEIIPESWRTVLFRSSDPNLWNTNTNEDKRFAIPVNKAPKEIRYLRLKRMDTGEAIIVPISHNQLTRSARVGEQSSFWNGTGNTAFGAKHLGIVEVRANRGMPPKGPRKDPPPK